MAREHSLWVFGVFYCKNVLSEVMIYGSEGEQIA
ncbi:hypothetical protein ES703_67228 [subsurface metagenome]